MHLFALLRAGARGDALARKAAEKRRRSPQAPLKEELAKLREAQ